MASRRVLLPIFALFCALSDVLLRFCQSFEQLLRLCYFRLYQPWVEYCLELTLDVSEEFAKSVIRESFCRLVRFVNGCFAWVVSLADRMGSFCSRQPPPTFRPWASLRQSTLNWVVARETEPQTERHRAARPGEKARPEKRQFWKLLERMEQFLRRRRSPSPRPVFDRPMGFHFWGNGRQRRGWVEDIQTAFEVHTTHLFSLVRRVAKTLLFLNSPVVVSSDSEPVDLSPEGPITAEEVITQAGYPQQSHDVVTDDGYILVLHRLPHPKAKQTVFFQHGVLDTSLGWIYGSVTDSLAFSVWDQGYDVWLGNTRSNPPRRHINPDIPPDAYWNYTLNELGMMDVGAQLQYIHKLREEELRDGENPIQEGTPHALHVVGHSLGAAALLVYLVMALRQKRPHFVRRIVLMSPAGFHPIYPLVLKPVRWGLPPVAWFIRRILKKKGAAIIVPGALTRLILFKTLQDVVQYPAIREFTKRGIQWLMSGDVSQWDFALQVPHYDVTAMPGIALHTALHFVQLVKTLRFRLYDYGTAELNVRHYGQPEPPDLAKEYGKIDIPVDIVAGRQDGVIPPQCVQMHVAEMAQRGVDVSYKEFAYGHLEFTAKVAHDLQSYVLDRLSNDGR